MNTLYSDGICIHHIAHCYYMLLLIHPSGERQRGTGRSETRHEGAAACSSSILCVHTISCILQGPDDLGQSMVTWAEWF